MKNFFIYLGLVISQITNAQLPKFEWAKSFGKITYMYGVKIKLDSHGSLYTLGVFTDTIDFDPGPGVFNLISQGSHDIFVSKMDRDGKFIWAKQIGGTSDDFGASITLDSIGSIYITGMFRDTVDFNPNPVLNNYFHSYGRNDMFILKLDSNGNYIWAKQIGGKGSDAGGCIIQDKVGNIYTAGSFIDTVDFDPGIRNYYLNATNKTFYSDGDLFILKLNPSGDFIWAKQITGTAFYGNLSIALDESGNIYSTGSFYDSADFNPDQNVKFVLKSVTERMSDIFIFKLDSHGYFLWAKSLGGSSLDYSSSIAIDKSGNSYITGAYSATTDFDPGNEEFIISPVGYDEITIPERNNIFILKLDPYGNFVWAKSIGGTYESYGNAIVLDGKNNIYTTGLFWETADFDPGPGKFNLSASDADGFISKLDENGNFIWANSIKGQSGLGWSISLSIDLDNAGHIYTAGVFWGIVDFAPGNETFNQNTSSEMYFVQKLNIAKFDKTFAVTIYPNPTNGLLNIISKPTINGYIEIYNDLGSLVLKKEIVRELNTFDLTQFAKGMFFIKLFSNNELITTQKVILY